MGVATVCFHNELNAWAQFPDGLAKLKPDGVNRIAALFSLSATMQTQNGCGPSTQWMEFNCILVVLANTLLDEPHQISIDSWAVASVLLVWPATWKTTDWHI